MPKNGQTAVVVPAPAADPILAAIAKAYPTVVRESLQAHVSLLYPFVPEPEINDQTITWLREFAAHQTVLDVEFTQVHQESGFVYLTAPELDSLAATVQNRWPNIIPYEGKYGLDRSVHLTLAMKIVDGNERAISEIAQKFLPLTVTIDQVLLLAFNDIWRVTHSFDFGG